MTLPETQTRSWVGALEAKPENFVSHSSNTSNAVCPPPEVTFNSEDADKRIMLKRTGKRFGGALYRFVLTPRQDMRPQKRASSTVPLEQPKLALGSSQLIE